VGRLPGVGKVTGEKLEKLGAKTVRDLRELEPAALEENFGRYGGRLYELARGIDNNQVVSDRPQSRSLLRIPLSTWVKAAHAFSYEAPRRARDGDIKLTRTTGPCCACGTSSGGRPASTEDKRRASARGLGASCVTRAAVMSVMSETGSW
jgi:hypothetical protein